MILHVNTVTIGAVVGIANVFFGARRTYFDSIAKTPRLEPEFKDFRMVYRSDGVRERAQFRARGYGQLALWCAIGLIIYAAATTLYPYDNIWAELSLVGIVTMAAATFRVVWRFRDRLSRAIENFDVYHYGKGRSFDSFEVALEKFALIDPSSYAIASRRLRARHKAAVAEQDRVAQSYIEGLNRLLA